MGTRVKLKKLIVYENKLVHSQTDLERQFEEREMTGVVLKSLPCVSQDQSPPCYVLCIRLSTLVSVPVPSTDSESYAVEDQAERLMELSFAISEAIVEKGLSFIFGLKAELSS